MPSKDIPLSVESYVHVVNPGNAVDGNDGTYAQAQPSSTTSWYLDLTYDSADLPTETIEGVEVLVYHKSDDPAGGDISEIELANGSGVNNDKPLVPSVSPSAFNWHTYGSPTDMWSTTDFQIRLQESLDFSFMRSNTTLKDWYIARVIMRVYYTPSIDPLTLLGGAF